MAGRKPTGGDAKPPGEPPADATPHLRVIDPAAAVERQPVSLAPDPAAARKGYVAAESPMATTIAGTPAVTRWRVYMDKQGERIWLGTMASHAQPEALIENFPGGMPGPGQVGLFYLRAINTENKETGQEFVFRISGDSPEVIAARKALTGTPGAAGPVSPIALDSYLANERAALQRQIEALAIERRDVVEKARLEERERAAAAQREHENKINQMKEEARIAREQEADRRRQEREDYEARLKADRDERERKDKAEREERERRDRLDREERDRRDRQLEAERRNEREREREHREALAALQAKNSLEGVLKTAAAAAATLNIKPGEILDRLFGGGKEDGAASTTEVVGKAIETGFTEFGQTARTWMELNHGRTPSAKGGGGSNTQETRTETRQIEDKGGGKAAEETPTPRTNPALEGVPMAVQRKARIAMRELIGELANTPREQYQAKALAAVQKTPAMLTYAKAVGVKAACIEAGMSEADAIEVEKSVPAGMLS